MTMTDIVRLHNQWRGFTAERSKAQKDINELIEKDRAEIRRLEAQIAETKETFESVWRGKKERLQKQRDLAVMQELANGTPAQTILKEMESNNTVWIYGLRRQVMANAPIPVAPNVYTRSEVSGTTALPLEPQGTTLTLTPPKWKYHDHVGVHGWLLSEDYTQVKKYGAEGTDFEERWFICSRDGEFIDGDEELFEATPKGEITKRSNMLAQLLDETYTKPVKLLENKYTG